MEYLLNKIHNRINNHNNVNFEHIDFYLHLEGVVATAVVLSLIMEPEPYTKLSTGLMIRTLLYCYYLLLDHENGKKVLVCCNYMLYINFICHPVSYTNKQWTVQHNPCIL